MVGGMLVICVVRAARARWIVVRVYGSSMEPLLAAGDRVLLRRESRCRVGDVVLFRVSKCDYPSLDHDPRPSYRIKLVTATAGDQAPDNIPEPLRLLHRGLVPDGHIAVAGTRQDSESSASLGYIPLSRVDGVVRDALRRVRVGRQTAARFPARSDRS
jgi:Peptidase S24-like